MKSTTKLKKTQHMTWRYALKNRVADSKAKLINKPLRWQVACMGGDREWSRIELGLSDVYRTLIKRTTTARFLQPF